MNIEVKAVPFERWELSVPYSTLFVSIFLFVVIPLAGGVITRIAVTKKRGKDYLENVFVHKFDNATTIGLLLTLVIIFSSQAANTISTFVSEQQMDFLKQISRTSSLEKISKEPERTIKKI